MPLRNQMAVIFFLLLLLGIPSELDIPPLYPFYPIVSPSILLLLILDLLTLYLRQEITGCSILMDVLFFLTHPIYLLIQVSLGPFSLLPLFTGAQLFLNLFRLFYTMALFWFSSARGSILGFFVVSAQVQVGQSELAEISIGIQSLWCSMGHPYILKLIFLEKIQ